MEVRYRPFVTSGNTWPSRRSVGRIPSRAARVGAMSTVRTARVILVGRIPLPMNAIGTRTSSSAVLPCSAIV